MSNVTNLRAIPTVLREASYHIVTWYHSVPTSTNKDDLLKPEFWAHVAKSLRPRHRIIVDCEDGTWTRTVFVRSVSQNSAVVAVIFDGDLSGDIRHAGDPVSAGDFDILWGSPTVRYRVVRKSDNAVLSQNHDTKASAEDWLENHMRNAA